VTLYAGHIKFDLGGIIYKSNDTVDSKGSPFDKNHGIIPSLGLEFGNDNVFLAIKVFDDFPFYAAGGAEIGLGRHWYGFYEHRLLFYSGMFESIGLGDRGEFKVSRKTALSIGLMHGGNDSQDDIYSFSSG
jgi:hypothetical protein